MVMRRRIAIGMPIPRPTPKASFVEFFELLLFVAVDEGDVVGEVVGWEADVLTAVKGDAV